MDDMLSTLIVLGSIPIVIRTRFRRIATEYDIVILSEDMGYEATSRIGDIDTEVFTHPIYAVTQRNTGL